MTGLLSIVRRELSVGARQTGTHRARIIAGGVVVAFFTLFLIFQSGSPAQVGPILFGLSSFLLFMQALLSGVRYTSDALSEEKREGTLGLLFLAEMTSAEIVLGKMTVRSLRGFYAMLATLPMFTICVLFGGVRGNDTIAIAALLLSTMIFSLSAGMFVSARVTEDKSAFIGTLGLLAGFSFIPLLIWKVVSSISRAGWHDLILYPSPFYAFGRMNAPDSLHCLPCLNAFSVLFLIFASRKLNGSFKQDSNTPKRPETIQPSKQKGWQIHNPGKEIRTATRPRKSVPCALLEKNPFLWLLYRERCNPILMRIFAAIVWVIALILFIVLERGPVGSGMALAVYSLFFAHMTWKLLLTGDALRQLHHDHRSGALEILLATPLTIDQILAAQLKRTFRVSLIGALALCAAQAVLFFRDDMTGMNVIKIGAALFLFIDGRTLAWTAMLQAFKPSRYPAATLRVAGIVLLPPTLILILVMYTGGGVSTREADQMFLVWYVCSAIYDAVLIHRAKRQLRNDFRILAANTPRPEPADRPPLPKFLQWLLLMEPKAAR